MSSESCSSPFIFSPFCLFLFLSFFLLRPLKSIPFYKWTGWMIFVGHRSSKNTYGATNMDLLVQRHTEIFETLVGLLSRHCSVLISNIDSESVGLKSIL